MSICILDLDDRGLKPSAGKKAELVFLSNYRDSKYIHPAKKALLSVRSNWVCLQEAGKPLPTSWFIPEPHIKQLLDSSSATAICQRVANTDIKTRILGVREILLNKPIFFNRHFLLQNSHLLNEDNALALLVQAADKSGSLLVVPSIKKTSSTFKYNRPLLSLLRNHLLRVLHRSMHLTKRTVRMIVTLPLSLYEHTVKAVVTIKQYFHKQSLLTYSDDIPVFIITRDRVEPLKKLVAWLEKEGLKKIIFIDNNSSNPKLLSYISNSRYEVVLLNKNIGHTSPWVEFVINSYAINQPFIVTDPDVIPDNSAHGAIKEFIRLLNCYPRYHKVGFGLHIDDLPDHYELKEKVISWEKQFWEHEVEKNVFAAPVDTTFALYRPNTGYVLEPALRTTGKFMARHDPWYEDSSNPTADLLYYKEHAAPTSSTWGTKAKDTSSLYV